MKRLMLVAVLVSVACVPAPEPDYCYRVGYSPETWYCTGYAQFPSDTVPDNMKDEVEPPVVGYELTKCITDSECEGLVPIVRREGDF